MNADQLREARTLRTLQSLVDCAGRRIVVGNMMRREAQALANEVRQAASRLIPDQMELYDLIYGSRFNRWIEQFCLAEES
jgi:hypothetical protein